MKKFIAFLLLFITAAGMALAAAKPEDIFTFKDGAWRVKTGGKETKFDGLSGTAEFSGGPIPWCVVNPDEFKDDNEAGSLPAGVLLYVKDIEEYGPPYVFLSLDEETAWVDGVSFSPMEEDAVVISRGSRFVESLSVYFLAPIVYAVENLGRELDRYQLLTARSDSVFWIRTAETEEQDSLTGLAFTLADEEVWRPEEAGLFGATAAIFCPPQSVERVNDGLVIVKKATKTTSYEVTGVSGDGKELILTEISVKSEKDWKDPDKWQESEIKVKIPQGALEKIPE